MRQLRTFLDQHFPKLAFGQLGKGRFPLPAAGTTSSALEMVPSESRKTSTVLLLLLVVAFAARLWPALVHPGINHPDELFQTLEQAHRLVFGYGLIPWEFEYGTRSWLLPGAVAALMWVGRLFGAAPIVYVGSVHLALAALATTTVLCSYFWGARLGGRWSGLAAAALPAVWPDALYFGARTLSECVVAPLLVIVLYLIDAATPTSRRRLFIAGFLLGVIVTLRIQVAPAVLTILLWSALAQGRERLAVIGVGLGAAIAFAGVLDAVTWGHPFQSAWRNLLYNTYYGVSSSFGTEPWTFYLELLARYWWPFIALLALFIAAGGRQLPLPLLVAAIILATHSLVPHKEHRFIYPAVILLLVVAGSGMARIGSWMVARRMASVRLSGVSLTGGSLVMSLVLASTPPYEELWERGYDMVRAASYVSGLSGVCGIGTYRSYGGYTYFHKPVPYYWSYERPGFERDLPAFNTMMTTEPNSIPPDYELRQCFHDICVAQRAGACEKLPPTGLPRPAFVPALAADRGL
jgi:GPI mannosyltransferase 3